MKLAGKVALLAGSSPNINAAHMPARRKVLRCFIQLRESRQPASAAITDYASLSEQSPFQPATAARLTLPPSSPPTRFLSD